MRRWLVLGVLVGLLAVPGSAFAAITPEQQQELADLRSQMVELRKEMVDKQLELRKAMVSKQLELGLVSKQWAEAAIKRLDTIAAEREKLGAAGQVGGAKGVRRLPGMMRPRAGVRIQDRLQRRVAPGRGMMRGWCW